MSIDTSKIRLLIQEGDLEDSSQQLLELARKHSSRFCNEVVVHTANLRQLLTNERRGVVSPEITGRERNRIMFALLDLIDEIEHELASGEGTLALDSVSRMGDSAVIRILFLAANPSDTTRLRLDVEFREIDAALRQAEFRDKFDLRQHWAVRVSDLQGYLLRHSPDIVHFSGHGSESSEIILEDDQGNSRPVSVRALSQLFSVLRDNIRCVVLNACYSEQQAQAIAEHIDCVIGMSKAVGDKAVISFAAAFYQALGFGRDVKTAFDLGCVQIDMENLNEQDTPKLVAERSDPKEISFVGSE